MVRAASPPHKTEYQSQSLQLKVSKHITWLRIFYRQNPKIVKCRAQILGNGNSSRVQLHVYRRKMMSYQYN